MSAPRVAVAGVVRRRQGIGEHLARFLAGHGAVVPAFLGSRAASLDEGRDVLARLGIDAVGYTDLAQLVRDHPIDALVVASPTPTHVPYVEAARDLGLSVLCEKPLVADAVDAPEVAERLTAEFAERGLVLWENVIWPFTLGAFRALHTNAVSSPLRHFGMRLSPRDGGPAHMLRESMSHPLSLLQTLAPPTAPGLAGVMFSTTDPAADRVEVSFRYPGGATGVAVRVVLEAVPEQPRPASFGVNGLTAERRIHMPGYRVSFVAGAQSVDVPDPLDALVAAFVATLGGAPAPDLPLSGPAVSWRARALAEIVTGFERVCARN